ncbi:MAG: FimV/HubP family polar landmark protein [Pseudomonadales bacterium]
MDRKLAIALSSFLGSTVLGNAYAIGLGDIKLQSALNEPLRAEIKLVQVNDLSENQIMVNLAPAEDFANARVEMDQFLNTLRFHLDLADPSNPKVVVTTRQPIREPFLNFLVEINWPSGRLLREYTLLMDLPTYSQSPTDFSYEAPVSESFDELPPEPQQAVEPKPQPVMAFEPTVAAAPTPKAKKQEAPPAAKEPEAKPAEQPKPVEQPKPEPVAEKPAAAESSAGSYGPTKTNDTLWRIARSVHGKGSIHQKLLAIQRLNPEAFNKNNVNLLKVGKVLRLPSQEEVASLGRAEAFAKMKEQEDAWRSGVSLPPPAGAQVDATGRTQQEPAAPAQDEGQLKLATPTPASDSTQATQGAGDQQNASELQTLQNDLAVGMEELNRVQRENQDVTSRIKDVDAQKANADKLLELQSGELAALQAKLAAEQQAKAQADALAAEQQAKAQADALAAEQQAKAQADALAAEQQAKAEAEAQAAAQQQAAVAQPEAQPAADAQQPAPEATPAEPQQQPVAAEPAPAPAVVEQPKPAEPEPVAKEQKAPAAVEPSLIDQVMNSPAVLGGIAFIVMLLGLIGYRRRATRQEEVEPLEEAFVPDSMSAEEEQEEAAEWQESEVEEASPVAVDEQTAAEQTLDTEAAPEVKAESGDVLGEADIYISFGNFEKGEALLNTAITAEPTRSDYRLKLLELYKETGKLAAFDEAYKALIELDDDAAIAKAGTLRAAIPSAAATPFAFGVTSAAEAAGISDEPEFGLDFDLDAQETVLETDLHSAETPMLDDSALDLSELDLTVQPEAACWIPALA